MLVKATEPPVIEGPEMGWQEWVAEDVASTKDYVVRVAKRGAVGEVNCRACFGYSDTSYVGFHVDEGMLEGCKAEYWVGTADRCGDGSLGCRNQAPCYVCCNCSAANDDYFLKRHVSKKGDLKAT